MCELKWVSKDVLTAGYIAHTCGLPRGHPGKHRCNVCREKK